MLFRSAEEAEALTKDWTRLNHRCFIVSRDFECLTLLGRCIAMHL